MERNELHAPLVLQAAAERPRFRRAFSQWFFAFVVALSLTLSSPSGCITVVRDPAFAGQLDIRLSPREGLQDTETTSTAALDKECGWEHIKAKFRAVSVGRNVFHENWNSRVDCMLSSCYVISVVVTTEIR